MAPNTNLINEKIINYLTNTLLKNKNIGEIIASTPLITGGLMDSISTMQLINFLEKEFVVEFEAHEVDKDNFDTVSIITKFVENKLKQLNYKLNTLFKKSASKFAANIALEDLQGNIISYANLQKKVNSIANVLKLRKQIFYTFFRKNN